MRAPETNQCLIEETLTPLDEAIVATSGVIDYIVNHGPDPVLGRGATPEVRAEIRELSDEARELIIKEIVAMLERRGLLDPSATTPGTDEGRSINVED